MLQDNNGGIRLNEKLYAGYEDGEVPEETITEGDLEEFFGIESNDSEFEENLSEDDKYFLKLCKDRQRA